MFTVLFIKSVFVISVTINCFYYKFVWHNCNYFRSQTIFATRKSLLVIVVIGATFWHKERGLWVVHLHFLEIFCINTISIIVHANNLFVSVYSNDYLGRIVVTIILVTGVDDELYDTVNKSRYNKAFLKLHLAFCVSLWYSEFLALCLSYLVIRSVNDMFNISEMFHCVHILAYHIYRTMFSKCKMFNFPHFSLSVITIIFRTVFSKLHTW